jgi:peptidoglycan/LPS O-acetylase OafA/YrhL
MTGIRPYYSLDIFRAVACIWIVLSHLDYSPEFIHRYSGLVQTFCRPHGKAVATFFVISGYCIVAAVENARARKESGLWFVYRRLIRILPPYWLSIPIVVFIPIFVELLSSLKSGCLSVPHLPWMDLGVLDWLRVATLTQIFKGGNPLSDTFMHINSPIWALAIIVQFYVIVSISCYCARHQGVYYGGITIVSLPFLMWEPFHYSGSILAYWPHFLLGILLFHLLTWFPDGMIVAKSYLAVLFVLVLIVLNWVAYYACTNVYANGIASLPWLPPLVWSTFFTLFCVLFRSLDYLVLDCYLARYGVAAQAMCAPWFFLTTFSYSVFLLHGKLYILSDQLVRQVVSTGSLFNKLASLLILLIMCYGLSRIIEAPFQGRSHRLRKGTAALPDDKPDMRTAASQQVVRVLQ